MHTRHLGLFVNEMEIKRRDRGWADGRAPEAEAIGLKEQSPLRQAQDTASGWSFIAPQGLRSLSAGVQPMRVKLRQQPAGTQLLASPAVA